jgi:hypothetical protein
MGHSETRFSVRCKACKSRFVVETAESMVMGGAFMAGRFAPYVMKAHSCEKIQNHVRAGYPLEIIVTSCFRIEPVQWKRRANGTTTKCGGACQSAKGPNCDCECHGKNHGCTPRITEV